MQEMTIKDPRMEEEKENAADLLKLVMVRSVHVPLLPFRYELFKCKTLYCGKGKRSLLKAKPVVPSIN